MGRSISPLLDREIKKLVQAGLFKRDQVFKPDGQEANAESPHINFASQDYLGLTMDNRILDAAIQAIERDGLGVPSTRMLCGTREIHLQLEDALTRFLELPAAVVLGSGYLANIGLLPAFMNERDFIFCDALISPSMAEGVRLTGAKAYSFRSNDLTDLEDKLKRSRAARFRAIVVSGVFPFDGALADLPGICQLAKKFDSLVVVDDHLGIGVLGERGHGSLEFMGVRDYVDVVTGTFGLALGGISGGFVAGRKEIIDWIRQKSTPFLFGENMPPPLAAGALKALEIVGAGEAPLGILGERTQELRNSLAAIGIGLLPGDFPIVAVHVGEAIILQKAVNSLYSNGLYVYGLCYPVVPEREARVVMHVTSKHSSEDIQQAVDAFRKTGSEFGLCKAAGRGIGLGYGRDRGRDSGTDQDGDPQFRPWVKHVKSEWRDEDKPEGPPEGPSEQPPQGQSEGPPQGKFQWPNQGKSEGSGRAKSAGLADLKTQELAHVDDSGELPDVDTRELSDDDAQDQSDDDAQDYSDDDSQDQSDDDAQDYSDDDSQELSDDDSQELSGGGSQELSGGGSRELSDVDSQEISEVVSQELSGAVSKELSEVDSQEISEVVSQELSEIDSQEISEIDSQEISEIDPQDLYDDDTLDPSDDDSQGPTEGKPPRRTTSRNPR